MTLEQTPAPARSDVARPTTQVLAPSRPFVREGMLLSAGALAWSVSMAVGGLDPAAGTWQATTQGLASGVFQLGVMALLTVLWRTRALGDGGLARVAIRAQAVVLTFAIGSTIADIATVSDLDRLGWLLLDMCWPLSMLGMFLIGVRIAVAGRWRGVSRFWPMVAESWAVVTVPVLGIFGESAAAVVAPLHLVVGYTVLGQVVARKRV
jgi:hypothetical protein